MKKRILSSLLALLLVIAALVPNITVQAAVKINKTSLSLNVGSSSQLKITGTTKKVTWSSSKTSVASVSSKGKVTAKKEGTATISAKVSGKTYKCKVTVKEKMISLTAEEIVNKFIDAGLNVGTVIVYDETTDPNNKLGRPNQYTSKVNFADSQVTQYDYEGATPVGGTVEVFNNSADAKARYDYIYSVAHGTIFEQYMYLQNNVLLRLDFELTPTQASEYEKVLKTIK
ncbi:Ig-like domain-containing protein [Anaerosporobacter sp.]|uniref:Ig-like domain-containing protein n=1 Tax=Anaerosporobacter sp. TaxID=1872529 RepID=UPI00286F010D|nr:Ig-like domain-containing protein [Anaerosporobacter sp.]